MNVKRLKEIKERFSIHKKYFDVNGKYTMCEEDAKLIELFMKEIINLMK